MEVPENFKSCCRLCGKHEHVSVDIFGDNKELKSKIETCLPLEVSEDDQLPNNLCYRCLLSLENFYEFYNKTIQSVLNLESVLHSSNSSVRTSLPIFNTGQTSKNLITFDRYTNTEPNILLIDASTLTDDLLQTKLYKDQSISTDDIIGNEDQNRNSVSKNATAAKKRLFSLVDYDSDTDSINSDNKNQEPQDQRNSNLENIGSAVLKKDENLNSKIDNIVPNSQTDEQKENITDSKGTDNLITEIVLRKNLCQKRSVGIVDSICAKKRKLIDNETEQNTSRRKSKQPKKIEYGNDSLETLNRTSVETENVECSQFQNCLLCENQFENNDLLIKHLYETHGLEPKEIFDPSNLVDNQQMNDGSNYDRSPKNNKKIPNLVRITDVLLAKTKGHDPIANLIKEETISSDSEIESVPIKDNVNNVNNINKQTLNPLFDLLFNTQINFNENIKEALWNEKQYFADNTQKILIQAQNESKRGIYLCQICARDFNDRASLWLHLRATHPKHASLACGICLKLCSSWHELREHTQTDHNSHKMTLSEIRKYYCIVCLRQHDSKKKLLNHVYVHDFIVDNLRSYGQQFDPELFVKVNFGESNENQNTKIDDYPDNGASGGAPHRSTILYSQLVKDEKMEDDIEEVSMQEYGENVEHPIENHPNTYSHIEENDTESGSNVYKAPRNYTLTYSCDWCARTLPSKWDRWQHVATVHAPDMPELVCSLQQCRKVFVTEVMRQEHEAHHQMQGPVPNSCEVCCKLWNTRVDFYKHMMGVHPQAVPLVCGVCLKIFPNVPKLYSHLQATHLPLVGDFVCNVCGRNYSNKSKMVRHRRIHGVTDSGIFLPPPQLNKLVNKAERDVKTQQGDILNVLNASTNIPKLNQIATPRSQQKAKTGVISKNTMNNDTKMYKITSKPHGVTIPKLKPDNYICKDCPGARFATYDEFSTHKRVLHQIFHCDLCTKYYGRNSHLWKHVNRCHKGNRLITCQICFKTSASKYHLKQHFNKIHALKSDKLKNSESLLDKKIDGYSFESVKQSFLRQELLEQKQKQMAAAEQAAQKQESNYRNSEMEIDSTNENNIIYPKNEKLPKEIDASSRLYASIITNYSPPANQGPHKCVKCGRGFHKRYLLKKHKKNCRPRLQKDLLTRCKTCERIFKDRQSLQKHLANYHSAFKCHLCNVTYASKCEIISHIRFNHPQHPDFVCDCGRILRSKADLHAHKSDHSNSQICQFCGDSLDSKMKLKMHVLSLHRKILSLSCGICLKLFETQHVLRDHVKLVHFKDTKFGNSCSVCGKKYGSKWKCYDHINKSHGKIFQPCKICLNVFETENEMQEHFKTVHLGLKVEPKVNTSKLVFIDQRSDTEQVCEEDENVSDDEPPTMVPTSSLTDSFVDVKPSIPKITLASNKNHPENYSIVQKTSDQSMPENYSFETDEQINYKRTVFQNSSKRTVYENSDDPSMCEICLKTWPAKKHLWQHYIRCHKSIAATICGICLKTNDSYAELRKHLHERHPSLLHGCGFGSNFICKICGRYHNARSKLKLHMAIHVNYSSNIDISEQNSVAADLQRDDEWINEENAAENADEKSVYSNIKYSKETVSDMEDTGVVSRNWRKSKETEIVTNSEPETETQNMGNENQDSYTDSELEETEMLRQHANIKKSRSLRNLPSRIKHRSSKLKIHKNRGFRIEHRKIKDINFRERLSSNDSDMSTDFKGFDQNQIDFSLIKLERDLAMKFEIYGESLIGIGENVCEDDIQNVKHEVLEEQLVENDSINNSESQVKDENSPANDRLADNEYKEEEDVENYEEIQETVINDDESNSSEDCSSDSDSDSENERMIENENFDSENDIDENIDSENEGMVENENADLENDGDEENIASENEEVIENDNIESDNEEIGDTIESEAEEIVVNNNIESETEEIVVNDNIGSETEEIVVNDNIESETEEIVVNDNIESENEEIASRQESIEEGNLSEEEIFQNHSDDSMIGKLNEQVQQTEEELLMNSQRVLASQNYIHENGIVSNSQEVNFDNSASQFNSEGSNISIEQNYEINLEQEMLKNMLGENQLCGGNESAGTINIAKNSNSEIAIESAIKSIEDAVASDAVFVDDETDCTNIIEIETNVVVMTENEIEIETAIESIL